MLCSVLFSLLLAPAQSSSYALIVAGSKTYENYRHQADAAHAYQAALAAGVPDAHVVTLLYDDVASDAENPYPGKLFNRPSGKATGVNVHKGLKPTYSGDAVTKSAVLGALLCNSSAPCLKGSGADDNIFVFWAGHGSDGALLLPTGDPLYADELFVALQQLHAAKRYGKLLFYLEACDSGAMFAAHSAALQAMGVLAFTAALPTENSYPAFCCDFFKPPSCTVFGTDIGSCLGDLWAVAMLEDMDKHTGGETIGQQFTVGKKGALPSDGNPGSHAQQYGDMTLLSRSLASFFGGNGAARNATTAGATVPVASTAILAAPSQGRSDSRLHMLRWRLARDRQRSRRGELPARALAVAAQRVADEVARRVAVRREFDGIATQLFGPGSSAASVLAMHHQSRAASSRGAAYFACLRAVNRARSDPYDAFSLQFMGVLAAACDDTRVSTADITAAVLRAAEAALPAPTDDDSSTCSTLVGQCYHNDEHILATHDISTSAAACCALCGATPSCLSFTHWVPTGRTAPSCWLYGSNGTLVSCSNATDASGWQPRPTPMPASAHVRATAQASSRGYA